MGSLALFPESAPFPPSCKPMPRSLLNALVWLSSALMPAAALAADAANPAEAYYLTPNLEKGDAADVAVTLEVGGEIVVPDDEGEERRLPMSVVARLAYEEQLVAW